MNENLMNMPGYRYAEYMVVLNPHDELRQKITHARKQFAEKYNDSVLSLGRPNITLAKFRVMEMMEEKISNRIKVTAMGTAPFKVSLKDYGSFPSHTIFIQVANKVPVQNLVKDLRVSKSLMRSPEADPYFITEPYITIARKLNPEQFRKGWLEFSHRSFTGSFIADGLLLLKRREGEKACQIVQRYEFMNLPVNTRQGELFV
jgi:2'-5' RNA ligase